MVDYIDTLNELKILHLKYYYLFFYLVSFLKFSKKHIKIIKSNFLKVKKRKKKIYIYIYIYIYIKYVFIKNKKVHKIVIFLLKNIFKEHKIDF